MAQWALQFTPCVTIDQPSETLLMEVQASLRLWGGESMLWQQLNQGWQLLGWKPPDDIIMAKAATPRLAQWLAHGQGTIQLQFIPEAQPHLDLFERMGIRNLEQLRKLPRAGVQRRFGKTLLQAVDAAFGQAPDLRSWISSPKVFKSRCELPARAETVTLIEQACDRLFHQLAAWLAAQQLGLQELDLVFHHDDPPDTLLTLGFASPARDASRFQRLLGEKLARHQLDRSVLEITLQANQVVTLPHQTQDFLGGGADRHEAMHELVERLQARLGHDHVQALVMLDEHRPEYAMACEPLGSPATTRRSCTLIHDRDAHRPSWMLPTPQPLKVIHHRPQYQGPLQLLAGPERIEAGWWDDRPTATAQRDYFIAQSCRQQMLWVFRTPNHDWYLHGIFS